MKHILFIAMNLNSGGAERQMVSLACALKEKKYDVSFICYEKGDFFLPELEKNGIKVVWLIHKTIIGRLISVRNYVRKNEYSAVISFLETPNILNIFSAFGKRSWRVITGERSSKEENLLSLRGRLVAFLQRYSDAIVCNSEHAAAMWRNHYPNLSDKINVIYNMVRLNMFSNSHLKNSTNSISMVVAASYQLLKNPINVIKAVSLLSDEAKSKFRLNWFGSAAVNHSVFNECIDMLNQYQLSDVIHLNGPTKYIHQEMASADYVGLFSTVEGLPNAICEAMALGKPVIMSKVSDYATLINGNGFLCDADNVVSIYRVLERVLSTSELQKIEMGRASRKLAMQLFDIKLILSKWENVILK